MQDLEPGSWQQSNLDKSASMIIPIPKPFGGLIVVGSTTVCYFSPDTAKQPLSAVKQQPFLIRVSLLMVQICLAILPVMHGIHTTYLQKAGSAIRASMPAFLLFIAQCLPQA